MKNSIIQTKAKLIYRRNNPATFSKHLPDGNDLTKVHLHVVDLSNKDGRQSLVECRPIHVNGGANRQNKSGDSLVNSVVLLQTLEGDGECGRTVV